MLFGLLLMRHMPYILLTTYRNRITHILVYNFWLINHSRLIKRILLIGNNLEM
jgi:hypothetical protein